MSSCMNWVSLVILALFVPVAFASLSITPNTVSPIIFGGEMFTQSIVVSNSFGKEIFVEVDVNISNESGDLNGFTVSLSDYNFLLPASESKTVELKIEVVPGIFPENYTVRLFASTLTEEPVVLVSPVVPVGEGRNGGGSWMGNRPVVVEPVDDNVVVLDDNVVEPVVLPKPIVPEVVEPVETVEEFEPSASTGFVFLFSKETLLFVVLFGGIVVEAIVFLVTLIHFMGKQKIDGGKSYE